MLNSLACRAGGFERFDTAAELPSSYHHLGIGFRYPQNIGRFSLIRSSAWLGNQGHILFDVKIQPHFVNAERTGESAERLASVIPWRGYF